MPYYKDDYTDFIMHHNQTIPRYKELARKALRHYLVDRYDPKMLDPQIELAFREFIYLCVHIKVINRVPYHWDFIDNYFKRCLAEFGFTDLEFDSVILDNRYHGGKYDPVQVGNA
ncbi:hypothetical protein JMG10_03435 [Nostoc ellipsosporum NOK]|nr:hypothetical protein [Nostoc ellipsosporum NOK]